MRRPSAPRKSPSQTAPVPASSSFPPCSNGRERRLKPSFFVPSVYLDITHVFPCQMRISISYDDLPCVTHSKSAIVLATLMVRPPPERRPIGTGGIRRHDVTRGTALVGGRQRLSAHPGRHHFRSAHAIRTTQARRHEGRLRPQRQHAARDPQSSDLRGIRGRGGPARLRGGADLHPEPA